jgi:hypothetical protein
VPVAVIRVERDDDVRTDVVQHRAQSVDDVVGGHERPRCGLAGHVGVEVVEDHEMRHSESGARGAQFRLTHGSEVGSHREAVRLAGLAPGRAAHRDLGAGLDGRGDHRAGAERLVVGMRDGDEEFVHGDTVRARSHY